MMTALLVVVGPTTGAALAVLLVRSAIGDVCEQVFGPVARTHARQPRSPR